MMTTLEPIPVNKFQAGDFKSDLKPIWCPGLRRFRRGHGDLSGAGGPRSGRRTRSRSFPASAVPVGFRATPPPTAFNTVHGRALPIAQGIKLANPELLVLVASGDGDGFSIGGGHVAHVVRRNMDLTYIVMDNQIYGLTKGQLSPTSQRGRKTVTSTFGSLEEPVNPLLYVLGYGASFVAQGSPADMAGLARIIEEGIRFPGFAFINVQSPCVTYGGEEQQLKAQKAKMQSLESIGHDPADRAGAAERAREYGTRLYTGILYRNPNPPPTYGQGVAGRQQALQKQAVPRHQILNRFLPDH
jgi:2-oxoglutarate ferredoxin oxidoreductase subunit beta